MQATKKTHTKSGMDFPSSSPKLIVLSKSAKSSWAGLLAQRHHRIRLPSYEVANEHDSVLTVAGPLGIYTRFPYSPPTGHPRLYSFNHIVARNHSSHNIASLQYASSKTNTFCHFFQKAIQKYFLKLACQQQLFCYLNSSNRIHSKTIRPYIIRKALRHWRTTNHNLNLVSQTILL